MEKITLQMVEKEGFEIIECITDCYVYSKVDLSPTGEDLLDDLDYGTYSVIVKEQEIDMSNSETLFTLFKGGECVKNLHYATLDEIKDYLKKYFNERK